jgi:segregation and condensation protein B
MLSPLCALIEGLLLVAPQGLDLASLARAAGVAEEGPALAAAIEELAAHFEEDGHGVRLQRSAEGVKLVTAASHAAVVGRFLGTADAQKLSQAALETLAVVAYCQPVTRARVEAIRGVNCEHILTALEERGLIAGRGRAESVGRPLLFGTTAAFLERFGLPALDALPPLPPELRELAEHLH